MATPSSQLQPQCAAALETFPRIVEKVAMMWKTPELDVFFHRLILDSRDGTRQGFPMVVAHEMMFLAETNRIVRAMDAAQQLQIELSEAYEMVAVADAAAMSVDAWDDPSVSRDSATRRKDARWTMQPKVVPNIESASNESWAMLGRFLFSKRVRYAAIAVLSVKLTMPFWRALFVLLM